MTYPNKILIVPDTNFLFLDYKSNADFLDYSFNNNFDFLVQIIEQRNLFDKCAIGLSEVVLEELLVQKISAFKGKVNSLKIMTNNFVFPVFNADLSELCKFDYKGFIEQKRNDFLRLITSKVIQFLTIPIPTNSIRFTSIVKRALEKRPPFEGENGKADKGFKDALLWESILDFKTNPDISNIIICTSDNMLKKPELLEEYALLKNNCDIEVLDSSALFTILNTLISDESPVNDLIVVEHGIKEFLSLNSNWKSEIIKKFLSLFDDSNQAQILDFNLIEYGLIEDEKYILKIDVVFEIITVTKTTSQISKKVDVIAQYSNQEWFLIEINLSGDVYE